MNSSGYRAARKVRSGRHAGRLDDLRCDGSEGLAQTSVIGEPPVPAER
jgi:hypothetical protein